MKKVLLLMAIAAALAACNANPKKGGGSDSTTPVPDSAKAQSDSLVNNAPDTLKAK